LSAGMEQVSSQVLHNSEFLINELERLPSISITSRTTEKRRSGIVSFSHDTISSGRLHGQLAESGITTAVRGDSIRLSPHFYQDESDLSEFVQRLEKAI